MKSQSLHRQGCLHTSPEGPPPTRLHEEGDVAHTHLLVPLCAWPAVPAAHRPLSMPPEDPEHVLLLAPQHLQPVEA